MSWNGTSIGKTDSVGITDIWNALGKPTKVVNGAVVNDYTINSLARHANINPYSLYKPMSVVRGANKTPYTLTDAANKTKGLTEDDMAIVNYGYAFPESGVGASVLKAWCINKTYPSAWLTPTGNQKAMAGGWIYCPPTGGESDPFRYGDFKGYNAKEMTFVTFEADYEFYTNAENTFTIGGKTLKDFGGIKDKYYGLYIVDANGTGNGLFYPTSQKVSANSGAIDITIPTASASTYFPTSGHSYYVMPVLFDTTSSPSTAYPLPVNPYKATAITYEAPQVNPYANFKSRTSVTSISGSTTLQISISWSVVSGTLSTAYPFIGYWYIEDKEGNSVSGVVTNPTINTTSRTATFLVSRRTSDGTNLTGELEINVDIMGRVPKASGSGTIDLATGIGAIIDWRSNSDWSQR